MAGEYDINLSNGSVLTTLHALETSGPDNASTPRLLLRARPKYNVLSGQNGSTINNIVVVNGDQTSVFASGETFTITESGSISDTVTYTVSSDPVPNTASVGSHYDEAANRTLIYIGPATFPAIPADGSVTVEAFALSGDTTYRFVTGFEFTVSQSGGNDGVYTVSASRLINNETWVRTNEPIVSSSYPLGEVQYEIGDNPIADTDLRTTLKLPGKGTLNYGEMLIENMVRMTENWAGDVPPDDVTSPITGSGTVGQALIGQYWYKTVPGEEGFLFYTGTDWSNDWDIDDGSLNFRDDDDLDIVITANETKAGITNPQPGLVVWSKTQKQNSESIFRVLDEGGNERLDVEYHADPTLGFIRSVNNVDFQGTGDSSIWSNRVAIGAGKQPTFDTTTLTVQGDGISVNSDIGTNSVLSLNSPMDRQSIITLEHNSVTNGHLLESTNLVVPTYIELASFNGYNLNLTSSNDLSAFSTANMSLYSTENMTISGKEQVNVTARDGQITIHAIDNGTGVPNAGDVNITTDQDLITTVGNNETKVVSGDSSITNQGNVTYTAAGGSTYTSTINVPTITNNTIGTVSNTTTGSYSETFDGNTLSTITGTSTTSITGDTSFSVTNGTYTSNIAQNASYDYGSSVIETFVGTSTSNGTDFFINGNSWTFNGTANSSPVTADFNVNVDGQINLVSAGGMSSNVGDYSMTTDGDLVFDSINGSIINRAFNGTFSVESNDYSLVTNGITVSGTDYAYTGTTYSVNVTDTASLTATNSLDFVTGAAGTINNTSNVYNVTASNTANIAGNNGITLSATNANADVTITANDQFLVTSTSNQFTGTSQFDSPVGINTAPPLDGTWLRVNGPVQTTATHTSGNGTNLTPAYGFVNYAGSGMYYDAIANQLSFSVGNTAIFHLDPTDNTLSVNIASYETLVTDPNNIPNKKYVDDLVAAQVISDHADVSTATPINGSRLTYNGTTSNWEPYDGTRYDEIVANGGIVYNTTYVTLRSKQAGKSFQQVYVNGVLQMEGKNYTVTSPTSLTFISSPAPQSGDDILIYQL